jgi:hypothetical protein
MVRFTITLSDGLYEALQDTAKSSGKTLAQLIEQSLEQAGIRPKPPEPVIAPEPQAVDEHEFKLSGGPLLYLNVVDKNDYQFLGYLGEVSREGLMLIANTPLPLEKEREIMIQLPNTEEFSGKLVEMTIEPRWARADAAYPSLHSVGCRLVKIRQEDLTLLTQPSVKQDLSIENKRAARKNLVFYLEVLEQGNSSHLLGYIGDLSRDGLLLIADSPMQLKQTLDIRVKLPDLEEFAKRFIEMRVETRWTKPDINPNLHCVGCQFVKISPENAQLVDIVQEVLGFT